jgi:hypothetical protein
VNLLSTTRIWLKTLRWHGRRTAAARRWGRRALEDTPIVLANAMPKSGSHLIYQVMQGLTRLGPFVNPGFPPVNRDENNEKLPDKKVLANLQRYHPGDIAYGYIRARQPFISLLTQQGRAMVFVYRDPRDMIVSHVFYATQMHTEHGMHRYYTETLKTMEERIQAAIRGVDAPGSELSPVRKKYMGYLGWLEHPEVLCIRFEDLTLDRQNTLMCILDYLERRGFHPTLPRAREVELLEQAIAPQRSGTFRKGQPGGWREHFTEANKEYFKQMAGDLLLRLKYEETDAW